jgi:hypothetical protein
MSEMKDKFKKSLEEYLDLRYTFISDLDHFTNGYCCGKKEILKELEIILLDGHEGTIVNAITVLRDKIRKEIE